MASRIVRTTTPLFLLAALLAFIPAAPAADEPNHKYALLIGINEYDHADLAKLDYAVNDVADLREVLTSAGYEVVLLTADEAKAKKDEALAATKANIETQVQALVKKFRKGDTLLIGLAGHGLQFEGDEDSYFCPVDARPFKDKTDTLVSVKWVYERLQKDAAAGVKLLLVDACRNDPKAGRGRGINADNAPPPPKGVGVLLSCSAGQRSFERKEYKHGVFFHHVLQGLKGEAKDRDGEITWDSLRSYVKKEVPRDEKDQAPEESGRLAGSPAVLIGLPEYDLTGGYGFVHFGRDRIKVVLTYADEDKHLYFARVYDAESGKPITPLLRLEDGVTESSISADGRRVVTTSPDQTARVWDAETGKAITLPLKHDIGPPLSASFTTDGRRVVSSGRWNMAQVWNIDTGKTIPLDLHRQVSLASFVHASFSADGRRVVTASWVDNAGRVWDAQTGKPITPLLKHEDAVRHAAFSPDGRRVLTCSRDKTARVWDAQSGKLIATLPHKEVVWYGLFSPDSRRVVTASENGTVRVWNAESGEPIIDPLPHEGGVNHVSFRHDGRRVVTAGSDRTAKVWDAETGKLLATLKHDGPLHRASFSPDGRRIVTIGDRTAYIWDAETGKELHKVTINPD